MSLLISGSRPVSDAFYSQETIDDGNGGVSPSKMPESSAGASSSKKNKKRQVQVDEEVNDDFSVQSLSLLSTHLRNYELIIWYTERCSWGSWLSSEEKEKKQIIGSSWNNEERRAKEG